MTQLTENLTVWELWYFKAVNQLSWRAFSSSYSPYNLLARLASIKWILLATRNFYSTLVSWRAVVSHTGVGLFFCLLLIIKTNPIFKQTDSQQKFKRNFLKNAFKIVVHISEVVNQKTKWRLLAYLLSYNHDHDSYHWYRSKSYYHTIMTMTATIGRSKSYYHTIMIKFLLALQLLLARPASIKWILLATRNFHSPLASGHFPHCIIILIKIWDCFGNEGPCLGKAQKKLNWYN
jgi:hypothetical protein